MKKLLSLSTITGLSVAAFFALTQPAKAIMYSFEFTDEDGSGAGRVPGETVTGTMTFNSLTSGSIPDGDYKPDSIVVTQIPDFLVSTWGDAGVFTTNLDMIPAAGSSFSASLSSDYVTFTNNQITSVNILLEDLTSSGNEIFQINNSGNTSDNYGNYSFIQEQEFGFAWDADNSTLTFSEDSAAVPFEFSPTLGLFLVGGLFGVSRYNKSRKAAKLIDNWALLN